ncbi:conserved hypothetical protein [Enterobacterales bacterium 8AC]|nr:conserved hypothetical protein [Enterobacterales bacterium 8AC]
MVVRGPVSAPTLPGFAICTMFKIKVHKHHISRCIYTSTLLFSFLTCIVFLHQYKGNSMATGFKNNRSTTKGIRFPHELIEEIDASVEREKPENPTANFSAWVLDACGRKLKGEQRKKPKDTPEG